MIEDVNYYKFFRFENLGINYGLDSFKLWIF